MKLDIISIGAATRDVFLRSKSIRVVRDESFSTGEAECFALGSKIEVDEIVFETGGGGTNTAVSFARQGLKIGYVGKIGATDARGVEIIRALKQERVDTSRVIKDRKRMTGYSVLLLTPRGERTVLVYRGASADVDPNNMTPRCVNAEWIYVSSLGGRLDTHRKIWRLAVKSQTKIAWNPGASELAHGLEVLRPLLKQAALVSLNQEEAARLLGRGRHQDESVFQDIRPLVGGVTLLTMGAEGALAGRANEAWHAGTRPIRVVDTTGAGDAFGSGFVGRLMVTDSIPEALIYGTANAESVIQHVGAKNGLLRGRRPSSPVTVTKR